MKRAGFALFFAMVVLVAGSEASIVKVTYTADNVVGAMYQNGGNAQPIPVGPNAKIWQKADTVSLDLDWGHEYQLIFLVQQYAGSGTNPAALLAQVWGEVENVPVLTSAAWEYSYAGVFPKDDFTGLVVPSDFNDPNQIVWSPATTYGNNGVSPWGTIAGINADAQWIWRAPEYDATGKIIYPPTGETLWLRTTVTTLTPEPTTFLIWSLLGGLALTIWRRR